MKEREHSKFWKLGNLDDQNAYLLNHIESVEKQTSKQQKRGVTSKPKNKSRKYKICDLTVCKEMLKAVYCVSNGRIGRILQQRDANPDLPPKDKRGGRRKEVDPIVMEKLTYVLKKLPKYVSHYEREKNKDNNLLYLEPDLTWDKVYDLVKEEVGDAVTKFPKMTWFYEKVDTLFPHVKTHTPSTDKCNTCSLLTLQEKTEERNAHQELANSFQKQLKEDTQKENCFTFDLQQVQPLPFIKENKAFYNRKTWLYNLGTHSTEASMFLWTEVMASRGAREITSCIYKYLNEYFLDENTIYDPLIAWSDTCGGQNRNFIMTCLLLRILHEHDNIQSLVHRFPISGHLFLPNDRDFGDVEKPKKRKDAIYTVDQYEEVMKKSKKKSPNVIQMYTRDFMDFTQGINFKNLYKPVDADGNKFCWLQIHEFRYEQGLFGFKFKYKLDDDYRVCLLGKRSTKSKVPTEPVFSTPPILHPDGRKLKAPKVLDMITLMSFVPPVHQTYFKDIIDSHQDVLAAYAKKKKSKDNDESEEELEPEEL